MITLSKLFSAKKGHILQPAERLLISEACLCSTGLFNVTIYGAQQL